MSRAAEVLWGKSNAGGQINLLLQHLLDTAAVAEIMWDDYLAPAVRRRLDACCAGRGRSLFALICGLHDVGKASPAFQCKDTTAAAAVQASGLTWPGMTTAAARRWHHTLAGAVIVRRALRAAGWDTEAIGWVWPLIGGHHGIVPAKIALLPHSLDQVHGTGPWLAAQDEIVESVVTALGIDLAEFEPTTTPTRATQLALLGGVIMADWVASSDRFTGVPRIADVSMANARRRAKNAWQTLELRGGWDVTRLRADDDLLSARFGVTARPGQAALVAMAESMPNAGLLVLEESMGGGKTEAALAAAEILARRFGADGVFVGMPTQATSDPMYTRVRDWVDSVQPDVPVGLLHGKRRFNKEWQRVVAARSPQFREIDGYGCVDDYDDATFTDGSHVAPAEWFLGPKRGLLMPVVVGTIDHLLHAATRTRHVMLRHAGLAGRVVVLDEVHAYDVYMSQFLAEALRWLAEGGVPVILLSATLPPAQRAALVRAYLQGALSRRDVDFDLPDCGYPNVLAACAVDGTPRVQTRSATAWRPSTQLSVEVLDERPGEGPGQVVALLTEALRDGGCALVVHNTVRRAQLTYLAARDAFGDDAVLLHARLAMGDRVARAERLLQELGAGGPRPHRLVVVATQLAEQSFDIDADLLVTDLAPIDLVLQRAGRLHRHARPDRPDRVATPRVVVTGMARRGDSPPWFPPGSSAVYGDHLLLRAAALVQDEPRWTTPDDIPGLVTHGYSDTAVTPPAWSDAVTRAQEQWVDSEQARRERASQFLLAGEDGIGYDHSGDVTLAGLHDRSVADLRDEDEVAAVVRDGDPSADVVLVRHDGRRYLTLSGHSMGVNGDATDDVLEQVLHSVIRLPADPDLTAAVRDELRPLPGWAADPWLRRAKALQLDDTLSARVGRHSFTYDPDLGLLHERSRR